MAIRALAVVFSVIFVLAAAVVVVALVYDWNDLRGPISRLASSALGRKVTLGGDLNVDLGWTTRIRIEDVAVANADWAGEPEMARVGLIDASVDVRELLSGNVRVPSLSIERPQIVLARNENGETNWTFGDEEEGKDEQASKAPNAREDIPVVESMTIDNGLIRFRDPGPTPDIELQLDTLTLRQQPPDLDLRIEGSGLYQDQPFNLLMSAGPFAALQTGEGPYPLDLKATAGDIAASVSGTIGDPANMQELNLVVDFKGDNAADLFPLVGLALPPTPPYQISGQLGRSGTAFSLADLEGTLGSSDIRGDLSVDFSGERPFMKGDLQSNRLDFADLAPAAGAPREQPPGGGIQTSDRPGRVLPDKEIDLTRLRAMDADVKFQSERIQTQMIPLDRFSAKVTLDAGTLRVQPASFGIGKGRIDFYASLYGAREPVDVDIEAHIKRLNLKDILRNSPFVEQTAGILGGRIKLSSQGTSVADILGGANGEMYVVMSGGQMSLLLVEVAGLDIAEALGLVISGSKRSTPVRCLVIDLRASQGLFQTEAMIVDTGDTIIVGEGTINMAQEALNLTITPYAKDFSPLTLRTPISIGGTLASPAPFPDPIRTGNETIGEKIISAILTPILGLLPPFDTELGEDAECSALVERAKSVRGS